LRVLHLLKTSVGATWALRQIRELQNLGVEVHVALPDGGPMVGRYAAVGATEHLLQTDFPVRAPWKFPRLSGRLTELVRSVNPDLIHSHFVGTTLSMRLGLGRGNSIPRVFQVPGPLHLEHPFFRAAEIATAGTADYWIGSCQWTCDRYLRSGVDPRRVFLSYYGLDVESFSPGVQGKLRRELGLDPNCPIVGMVAYMYGPKRYLGQRRGLKGHEDLIDACRILLRDKPDLRCVIVGGPWNNATDYEKELHGYAWQRCGDRVIFLGTRYDIPDLYVDFDVAVHPSHSENVGGAGESCLLGVPTVATNVGGFPDLVRDGETGWLVPASDPQALAGAIRHALDNREMAQARARAGQKLSRNLLDVKRTAPVVLKIYRQILDKA
jgi:glycosyltransferase involved in cell wall biosynthesis